VNEIAVLQMGKCGSSTVIELARKMGIHASRAYHPMNAVQAQYQYVISMVREPVGRNVSAFFHDMARTLSATGEGYSQAIVDEFLMVWDGHDVPLAWHSEVFQPETGIDVYAKTFNRRRGWSIYEGGGRRILVIRTEDMDARLLEAMAALLEQALPLTEVEHRAQDLERPHGVGDLYREFMEKAVMPGAYLDRVYGSKYAKHFYYAKEIGAFRKFWSAPR